MAGDRRNTLDRQRWRSFCLTRPFHRTEPPDGAQAKRAFKAMMQMKKIDIAAIEEASGG
jgi:hypothetical protein